MAETLSYIAETYQLLPPEHYGGRPGRTGEEAMLLLTEKIKHAWKEQDEYAVIFMDIAGAFNNVHPERLLHDLRKRRIPEFIVRWVESFLSRRSTSLRFNGIDSEKIHIEASVPQGSPISPILYLFYNADLLKVPGKMESQGRKGTSWGFIDDIAYGIQGGSDEETARKLEETLRETEKWREKHGARFEPTKYILIHFTRRKRTPTASITIANTTI
jgi:hypothetical protein